ncbi:amino acid permease-domain-containing protein [Dactylonectria macrodidyma]|uniref:Amino acid permease-domain-containing protein n=1 Tax=Dactylonectria macrodidyma TaxID=307937 RepID=A0A9P9JN98_9HYPO|nr:amino acid permease-domain-containing protein [Dactylonectria macrodidyma]
MQGTHSTGASLLLWFAGIIYCLSGMHVYIEYGLNVPRYVINGVEQSVPRSGGDLNYLQYVYRKPAYRKDTVLLSTCLFAIAFIALGNMAGNSISFAIRVLRAADVEDPSNGAVRGIALGIAVLTCFIHTVSRRGGIFLNNVLAIIKVLILLLIIVTAIVVGAGGLKKTDNIITDNTSTKHAFAGASGDANGYAQAFLAIIFSFSGFEQPNYVLGEISRPKRKHPIAMILSVSTVVLLYMAVNISYMVVVPKEDQINYPGGVAQRFFELTLGQVSDDKTGIRIFNAFLAIASMGNIIVMTYTAARVKQEIAKEGIIPFAKFFASDRDLSLGRLLKWLQKKGWFTSILRIRWFSPEEHTERTPVGAFILHLISCVVLIFATWGMTPDNAYTLLTSLSAYTINAFFGTFLGIGILILRFRGPPATEGVDNAQSRSAAPLTWSGMTGKRINPALSVTCALIYTIGGLWPVVNTWIKPNSDITQTIKWWLAPAISWIIIASGVVWFLGFVAIAWRTYRNHHKVFVVEKKPHFEDADGFASDDKEGRGSGGLVLVHETVFLSWVGKETLRHRRPEQTAFNGGMDDQPVQPMSLAGTDFDMLVQGQQQEQRQEQQFQQFDQQQPYHQQSQRYQYDQHNQQQQRQQYQQQQHQQYYEDPHGGYGTGFRPSELR